MGKGGPGVKIIRFKIIIINIMEEIRGSSGKHRQPVWIDGGF